MLKKRIVPSIVLATLLATFGVLYPLLSLFAPAWEGIRGQAGELSILGRVALITLLQATLSVLGSFALGAPVGLLIARSIGPSSRATLLSLYSMPTMVVATTVLSVLHSFSWRYSLIAVVVAHSLLNAPWIALQIAEGFRDLPRAWLEMARSLGADSRTLLGDFFIPFIRVNVLTGALQVFTLSWMSFTLVLLLGGGPPISTLETEIFASFRMGEIQLERAALFSLAQFLLGLVPVLIWVRLSQQRAQWSSMIRRSDEEEISVSGGYPWMAWLLFLPYLMFIRHVFQLPLGTWKAVLLSREFLSAFAASVWLALMTGALTLLWGGVFSWAGRRSSWVRILANLPSGVSTLVLCAGFFFAYPAFAEGGWLQVALLQSVTLVPLAFRWMIPRLLLEDLPRLGAARSLGASPARAFRDVELWKWTPVLLRVFAAAFVWSLGEYSVIAFFGGVGERELLPQYLAGLFSRYAFDEAQIASFAVLLFTWGSLQLILIRGGRTNVG